MGEMNILFGAWQFTYRSVAHGMQLDETTRLKSAWHQNKIGPSRDHVRQRSVELHNSHSLAWEQAVQLLQLLLKMFLASSLSM